MPDQGHKERLDAKHTEDKHDNDKGDKDATSPKEDKDGDQEKPRSRLPLIILGVVIVLALIGGLIYWFLTRNLESTDDAYTDGRAVTITPHVSGYVTKLLVDDNQPVHAGDILIEIDERDYVAAREQAMGQFLALEAQVTNARIGVEKVRISSPAQLAQAQGQLTQARGQLFKAEADNHRQSSIEKAATSQQNIDAASSSLQEAQGQVQQASAQVKQAELVPENIAQAEAQVMQLEGQLMQARGSLAQADLNLSYTKVTAPQDGWVTRRNIEQGDYAVAGSEILAIVVPQVWITANFKENQLDRMHPGQRVAISVDAYPSLKLRGHVDSIQLGSGSKFTAFPAENATGNFVKIVQRVPVKIIVDDGIDPNRPAAPWPVRYADGYAEVSGEEKSWKPKANPWVIALVVTLAAFMEVLDTTIVNVALPHIAGTLSVSSDDATWTLTSYLVANGIVLTVSGWLGKLLGRKRYFMICIGMFAVCSLLCGIAGSLTQLILFRLAQGFFGGGLQPNQQSIILDTFEPSKRGQAFALTAIATVVAPVLGPTLGGWITDNYSWRWIFFINVPIGVATLFAVAHLVEDPPWERNHKPKGIDGIGLALIALGLGCLQIVMDRGQDEDWFSSNFIIIFAILAAIGISGAITWLLYTRNPVVNIRVLGDGNFAICSVLMVAMASILYASAVVLPQLAQQVLGYTATLAGLILSPGAMFLVLLIPFVTKLMQIVPTKYVIAIGFSCLGSAMVYSHGIAPDIDFNQPCDHACGAGGRPRLPVCAADDRRLRQYQPGE